VKTLIFVGIGGAIGSIFRYLTSVWVQKLNVNSNFPWATFLTNGLGCLLIGILMGYFTKHNLLNSQLKWLLVTGFCGGYTTFSTFGFETLQLTQNQQFATALLYTISSVCIGITAVFIGLWLTR
jgi:CrcB protein